MVRGVVGKPLSLKPRRQAALRHASKAKLEASSSKDNNKSHHIFTYRSR